MAVDLTIVSRSNEVRHFQLCAVWRRLYEQDRPRAHSGNSFEQSEM